MRNKKLEAGVVGGALGTAGGMLVGDLLLVTGAVVFPALPLIWLAGAAAAAVAAVAAESNKEKR